MSPQRHRDTKGAGAIGDDSGTDNEIKRRISMSVPRLLRHRLCLCVFVVTSPLNPALVRQYFSERLHGRLDDFEWMSAGNPDVVPILLGRRKPFPSENVNVLSSSATLDL